MNDTQPWVYVLFNKRGEATGGVSQPRRTVDQMRRPDRGGRETILSTEHLLVVGLLGDSYWKTMIFIHPSLIEGGE